MSDTDRPMQMISGAYVHLCQCGQWGVYGLTRREASLSVGGAGSITRTSGLPALKLRRRRLRICLEPRWLAKHRRPADALPQSELSQIRPGFAGAFLYRQARSVTTCGDGGELAQ